MARLDTTVVVDLGGRGGQGTTGCSAEEARRAVVSWRAHCHHAFYARRIVRWHSPLRRSGGGGGQGGGVNRQSIPDPGVPLDATVRFGAIVAARRKAGRPIEGLDALIAATTSAAGHSLITRNPKDFA